MRFQRSIDVTVLQTVHQLIGENAAWGTCWAQYLEGLAAGKWPSWYVDMVMQGDGRLFLDLYDAYCFAQVHTMLHTGQVAWVELVLGKGPTQDANAEENNRRLRHSLPSPFLASFTGGTGDCDGYVEWHRSVGMQLTRGIGDSSMVKIEPTTLPLEVGITQPCTTLNHILTDGGLARWPYGGESVYLLVSMN